MNAAVSELETLLDPSLPKEFELRVPDEWFKGLLRDGLVFEGTTTAVPDTYTSVTIKIHDHRITVRADSDPEGWRETH